jgi:lipopolysaccharide heptosyltransferase I
MKVLLVKLSALGDVVQALPVAMAIKRQMPQAQVDWVVERPSAGLLYGHPALNRILVSPRHVISDHKSEFFRHVIPFIRQLRAEYYDAVLDLQGLMKSAMVVALSRGRRKIGFKGGKEPLASWPLNLRLDPYDPDRHALKRYLDVLEPLGILRPSQAEFGLQAGREALDRVGEMLGRMRANDRPLVVLHPMALWPSKLWPVSHWAELARMLAGQGLHLVLSGAPADRPVTEKIASLSGVGDDLLNLAGRTGLPDMVALLSLADVLVSTDTGVMHLAAALDTPVVALFGPTAPWRTGPHGQGHQVLRLALDCSPCLRRRCDQPVCLNNLAPETVAEATRKVVSSKGL